MRAVSASAQGLGRSLLPVGVHSPSLPRGERTPCQGPSAVTGRARQQTRKVWTPIFPLQAAGNLFPPSCTSHSGKEVTSHSRGSVARTR